MKKDKVFKFYSDDQHGWLAVKKTDLDFLGITNKITYCSYTKGNTVYLEEDYDAGLFFKAFETKFGLPPRYETVRYDGSSPIRNYFHYKTYTYEGQ